MGYQFLQWFMNLSKLVSLELTGCNRCRELHAGLGELAFLQLLSLSKLENLTCIGLSFYGIFDKQDGRGSTSECKFFPALKSLTLEEMVNLVEWRDPDEVRSTTDEDVAAFRVLKRLSISGCSQLTTAPTPSHFPTLEELEIRFYCHSSLAEKVLNNITTLSSLKLDGSMSSRHNSEAHQHRESLDLVKRPLNSEDGSHQGSSLTLGDGCELLPSEMVERLCHFPSLQHLQVSYCPNVTSLRRLNCGTCLESLKLFDCDNLRELPENLYKFQALRDLSIRVCPLIDLGENRNDGQKSLLKSLKSLTISDCDGLTI
ncbi:uncharacterized protein [Coffea arabica]|uniref:Disease resistance protein At3g14460 n=1 Tax=Coffea arabica TaxID=13443 RepID=A0ABM4X769_COFAR